MIKGVLFDFDGVVVQSEKLHMETFLDSLRDYGVVVSEGRWYKEFAGTGSRHIFEVLTEEYGISEKVDDLIKKRKKIYEDAVKAGRLELTDGIVETLQKLRQKNIKTAIVSGSDRTNVLTALDVFKLGSFFDVIVSGSDIKERKPDPEPFLYAARKLGLEASECIAIEDSISGVNAVIAARMKLVVVISPAKIDAPKGTVFIDDFRNFNFP
jgi:HAD superfamily hydrolase (TIGR01509 family)